MNHINYKARLAGRTLAGLALLAGSAAWAHNPVVECRQVSADTIVCRGGFSDGSLAPGVKLDVMSYDDKVLMAGKLGKDSTLSFKKPKGEFFVLFDAGPGHIVEVDHPGNRLASTSRTPAGGWGKRAAQQSSYAASELS